MLSVKFWELDLVFSLILIGLMNEARRWLFKPSNTCVRSRGKCEALLPSCHLITPYLQCTVYWETYHLSLPIFLISWPGDKDFKLTQPFLNWLEATSGGDVPQIPAQTRRSQEIFKPKETSWNPIPSLSPFSEHSISGFLLGDAFFFSFLLLSATDSQVFISILGKVPTELFQ